VEEESRVSRPVGSLYFETPWFCCLAVSTFDEKVMYDDKQFLLRSLSGELWRSEQ